MGYIEIPKLDLRAFHRTRHGGGRAAKDGRPSRRHVPAGRRRRATHAVLSAHRGLPTAKLFSDLDLMQVGDRFTIYTLNQALTYRGGSNHGDPAGRDRGAGHRRRGRIYVTLMTCTPYAVNTHRLLVRGSPRARRRADSRNRRAEPEQRQPLDARRLLQNVVLPATAAHPVC